MLEEFETGSTNAAAAPFRARSAGVNAKMAALFAVAQSRKGIAESFISLGAFAESFISLGAFEEFEAQRDPEREVRRQLQAFRFSSLPYQERLIRRIHQLIDWAVEEGEPMADAAASLRNMLRFLSANRHLAQPITTMTPSGTFRAEWTESSSAHLAINFLPSDQARFVVFCRTLPASSIQRISGVTSIFELSRLLFSFGVSRWAYRERPPHRPSQSSIAPLSAVEM